MIGWIFAAFFIIIAIFVTKEMVKKFGFEKTYARTANAVRWHYKGSKEHGLVPGMHTVVLKAPNQHSLARLANKPLGTGHVVLETSDYFTAKLAFKLVLPFGITGVDTFGCIESGWGGVISFSTYLGRGKHDFIFFITRIDASQVTVSVDPEGAPAPTHKFPPHWWQRLGFWG